VNARIRPGLVVRGAALLSRLCRVDTRCHNWPPRERAARSLPSADMIGTMTNHTKPTLLISNVLPARPGDEAYNNIWG